MGQPTVQWDLGVEALNGRDGDTLRVAGQKYNIHTHFSANVEGAISQANTPSAANPFATIADIPSESGSSVELAIENILTILIPGLESRLDALEPQVATIPDLESRIAALEGNPMELGGSLAVNILLTSGNAINGGGLTLDA